MFFSSEAWSLELEAPAIQHIKPGGWLSLAFVVKADDQERAVFLEASSPHHEPKIKLPLGWSLLVPPPSLDLSHHEKQTLTLAVTVPTDAPAGRYRITLTIGPWSVTAQVVVDAHHTIQWLGESQSNRTIHQWWTNRPWSLDETMLLVGNQALAVRLEIKAPKGIKVTLSDTDRRLVPGVAQKIVIGIRRDPNHLNRLAQRMTLAVDVLDANTGKRLATRRWVLVPFNDDFNPSLPKPWGLSGFLDWQSSKNYDRASWIKPHDWGVRGSGDLSEAGRARVEFAWHRDLRWGRYVEFEGSQLRWQVGHRVFLGERINGLSRLGKGQSVSWQSDQTDEAWRFGWIDFKAQGTHYQSPWLSRGGWRVATINASSNHSDTLGLGSWWSLAYQHHPRSKISQPSALHQWKIQLTGNHDRLASRVKYRYQPQRDAWLDLLAEAIPTDHISGLAAGRRVLIESRRPIQHGAYLTASLLARQQRGVNHTTDHHTALMLHHWQALGHSNRFRLGFGGAHRRYRRVSFDSIEANAKGQFRTHKSALTIRWMGDWKNWHGSARFDTRERFAFVARFNQRNLGTWRLTHQNTYSQLSLSSGAGPWRWSGAIEKRRSALDQTRWDEGRLGLDGEVKDTLRMRTDPSARFHLKVSRRVGRAQEWSLAVSPGAHDHGGTTWWLRYRWRGHTPSLVPVITDVLGPVFSRDQRHMISGRVERLTPAGPMPVKGALISLNDRQTQTDAQGHYQFVGVAPGPHRLSIDPWLNNSTITSKADAAQNWLLSTDDSVDLWVDLDQSVAGAVDALPHSLSHDWLWVIPGRVVVDVTWPDESPVNESAQASIMEKARLVGTCEACPSRHQRRTATRNAQGQWVVFQLLPGRWQWQWVGALLPSEHRFKESVEWIDVASGQTKKLTWEVDHHPQPIEWQSTQSVDLRD